MKYRFIDSMRGIAILMVIAVHTRLSIHDIAGMADLLARYGQMGVQLFFVASAYTLCLSWERRRDESLPILGFYLRRLFRIAPAYYLIGIAGYMMLRILEHYAVHGRPGLPDWYTLPALVSNLLFFHGLYPPGNNVIVPGGWSIGTEMLFYLVFPLLIVVATGVLRQRALILGFPLLALLVAAAATAFLDDHGYPIDNNNFMYFSIVNQAPVFALGMSLYFLHREGAVALRGNLAPGLVFCLFTAAAVWIGWIQTSRLGWTLLPFLSGVSFVALTELFRRNPGLNHPLLCEIGKVSYSMYLLHFLFALELSELLYGHLLHGLLAPAAALGVCYLLTAGLTFQAARLSYKHIERPFIDRGRRIIGMLSRQRLRS